MPRRIRPLALWICQVKRARLPSELIGVNAMMRVHNTFPSKRFLRLYISTSPGRRSFGLLMKLPVDPRQLHLTESALQDFTQQSRRPYICTSFLTLLSVTAVNLEIIKAFCAYRCPPVPGDASTLGDFDCHREASSGAQHTQHVSAFVLGHQICQSASVMPALRIFRKLTQNICSFRGLSSKRR